MGESPGNTHLATQPIPACWRHLQLAESHLLDIYWVWNCATAVFGAQVFSGVASVSPLVLLNQQLQIYRENGRVVKDIWESKYLVPISALPLNMVSNTLTFSQPQFPHVYGGVSNSTCSDRTPLSAKQNNVYITLPSEHSGNFRYCSH